MKWKPKRNGGNSTSTRFSQSLESRDRDGHGRSGFSGHHSWAKGRSGGRNKTGATTHAPKEWGRKARKEEERLTGLAKQAEQDAIREGLVEMGWDSYEIEQYFQSLRDADLLDEAFDACLPDAITFNGLPVTSLEDDEWLD